MLIHIFRIVAIFKVRSARKLHLPDRRLLRRFIPLLVLVSCYLAVWTSLDRSQVIWKRTNSVERLKFTHCSASSWAYGASLGKTTKIRVILSTNCRQTTRMFTRCVIISAPSHIVVKHYYSHFIGHLLSRYRRISDCLYSIVYGQAGRYAPYRPSWRAVMHHNGPHSSL